MLETTARTLQTNIDLLVLPVIISLLVCFVEFFVFVVVVRLLNVFWIRQVASFIELSFPVDFIYKINKLPRLLLLRICQQTIVTHFLVNLVPVCRQCPALYGRGQCSLMDVIGG